METLKFSSYKYIDVAKSIYSTFIKNENKDNQKLPSERNLANKYNVSRVTIRKSLKILEEKKYIYREHGKGTYINHRKIAQPVVESIGFSELAELNDYVADTKLIDAKLMIASCSDVDQLNITNTESKTIVYIARKRFLDNQVVSLEISRFKNDFIFLLDIDLETESIYKQISNKGHLLKIKNKTIEIVRANKIIANELNVATGSPIILNRGVITNQHDNITNTFEEYLLADTFKFKFSQI